MSQVDDAIASAQNALATVAQVVAALEGEPQAVEYSPSVITNADGSIIVTLTPAAPAAVSSQAEAQPAAAATGEPTGTTEVASETGDTGPTPTGQ